MVIRQALAAGQPIPAAIVNAPELLPGLSIFLDAFLTLKTERGHSGHFPGPIPWSKIDQYGRRQLRLQGEQLADLQYHVRTLDDWDLARLAKRLDSQNGNASKPRSGFRKGAKTR